MGKSAKPGSIEIRKSDLIAYRGGKGQTFVYELAWDGKGKDGKTFLHGLIDVSKLRGGDLPQKPNYDANLPEKPMYDANRSGFLGDWSGQNDNWSGGGRPQVMHLSGGGRGEKITGDGQPESVSEEFTKNTLKNT